MHWFLFLCLISTAFAACPNIIGREDWGGLRPTFVEYIPSPVQNVIIHHTVTPPCFNIDDCSDRIVSMQRYHMNTIGCGDIGYSFLVGGDGNIYEGRGWHKQGCHTYGYNSRSIGIGFIGTFTNVKPPEKQLQAAKDLLECGVDLNELSNNYNLYGASQVSATQSPGAKLFNKIQYWTHFSNP